MDRQQARDILDAFDADENDRSFFADILVSNTIPQEDLDEIKVIGLARSDEEFDMFMEHAVHVPDSFFPTRQPPRQLPRQKRPDRSGKGKSPYWAQEQDVDMMADEANMEETSSPPEIDGIPSEKERPVPDATTTDALQLPAIADPSGSQSCRVRPQRKVTGRGSHFFESRQPPGADISGSPVRNFKRSTSPVSSLEFPALDAPQFGLIQEEVADDPFALLVAVTLLIKTTGRAAIPVFREVRKKWPTPEAIAGTAPPSEGGSSTGKDAEKNDELLNTIRKLGLGKLRASKIRLLAKRWIQSGGPQKGKKFLVRDYEGPLNTNGWVSDDGRSSRNDLFPVPELPCELDSTTPTRKQRHNNSAWEIGHLTQGRYAVDSWRIFCRDNLLGRGQPHGSVRREDDLDDEPPFQPEWMRVRPRDKELRAYLRWMWMREGFDWNPRTGETEVLEKE